jgi:hypothetical protein
MVTYGHWTCAFEFDANEFCGFIYKITHKATGKRYIGRKLLVKTRRKQVACKSKPGKKTQVNRSASNWKTYTSSSRTLNEDIIKWGKDAFIFEILSVHTYKSTLAYEETYQLITNNALIALDRHGHRAWWNESIPAVRCPPKQLP